MAPRWMANVLIFILVGAFCPVVLGAEKIKLGTAIRQDPAYFLPIYAGEEAGLWKAAGLEVEWTPFRSAAIMHRAITAGSTPLGFDTATGHIQAISRGVPSQIVAALQTFEGVRLYVDVRSPVKNLEDLKKMKTIKIGITRLGSTDHAKSRQAARILGLEKQIKYIGTGGISEKIAALRAGAIDAFTIFLATAGELVVRGDLRELMDLDEYQPKEWMAELVFAHRDQIKTNPDLVGRLVKATLQGVTYVRNNRDWSIRMMNKEGYSSQAGAMLYDFFKWMEGGRIDPRAVANVRQFLLDLGILPAAQAPPAEQLYTLQFIP